MRDLDADSHAHCDHYANIDAHRHTDPDADHYANTDADRYADPHGYADPDRDADTDADDPRNGDTYPWPLAWISHYRGHREHREIQKID